MSEVVPGICCTVCAKALVTVRSWLFDTELETAWLKLVPVSAVTEAVGPSITVGRMSAHGLAGRARLREWKGDALTEDAGADGERLRLAVGDLHLVCVLDRVGARGRDGLGLLADLAAVAGEVLEDVLLDARFGVDVALGLARGAGPRWGRGGGRRRVAPLTKQVSMQCFVAKKLLDDGLSLRCWCVCPRGRKRGNLPFWLGRRRQHACSASSSGAPSTGCGAGLPKTA